MKNIKRISNIVITLIFIILIVISLYNIIKWLNNTSSNRKLLKEINTKITIKDDHDGKRLVDFNYLKDINSDTVGYISIDGTNIKYPVVRSTNNDYYLNHSFDKTKNSAGWIFMDYRNNNILEDKNTIIYGHNMKDGSMFGKLKILKSSDIDTINYYDSDNNKHTYKIFSIYEVDEEDYYITTLFDCGNEYIEFLHRVKGRSIKDYLYEPKYEDNILTLSTCSSSKKRLVVHAYKVN